MFGYEFVTPSPDQVEARRKALDRAGSQAHMLPLSILGVIVIYRFISRMTLERFAKTSSEPTFVQLISRRVRWTLTNTYIAEFGQLHVQVFGVLYAAALLYLIFRGAASDYMHVTKAFGHVAVSQLPYQYWLSAKHPKLPLSIVTGLTHERLNAYHRLFGRIVHGMMAVHAILYLRFFVAINALSKRVGDWDVRYGLMAIWTLNFLGMLAIGPIRKKAYHKIFYRSHIVLSIVLPVIIWLHVRYTRIYAAEMVLIWVGNWFLREDPIAEEASVTCRSAGEKLIRVVAKLKKGESWNDWLPGTHAYLVEDQIGPKNPFTVVSVDKQEDETEVSFVVRDLGGPMTDKLGKAAIQEKSLNLRVEGPYGEAGQYMSDYLRDPNQGTLLVAGGVGATYALPIYLAMTKRGGDVANLKFVWVVKQLEDAEWGLKMLEGTNDANVHIFVTQGRPQEKATSVSTPAGIEIHTTDKRPDFSVIVDDFLSSRAESKSKQDGVLPGHDHLPLSVMVCGPGNLPQDLKKAIGRHVWSGREVKWYEEQFGFGGS